MQMQGSKINKEGLSLWLGNQSQNLAYSYYNLASQQIFDEQIDPINHQAIFKDIQKKIPRMVVAGTQIDRLKAVRQVNHHRMLKKLKTSGQNNLEQYFGYVDKTGIMSYEPQYSHQDKEQQKQAWGQFTNWRDSQKNYFLFDTVHSSYNFSISPTSLPEIIRNYEQCQQSYKLNQDNFEDKLRKQLQDCDYLKFITVCSDETDQGFLVKTLEYLHDECPKIPKIVNTLNISSQKPRNTLLANLPTFSTIFQFCDIYIPIDSPQKYSTFQLQQPQIYEQSCRKRLEIYQNLAPLFSMIYTPLNMSNVNCDEYLASILPDNRKLFNIAYNLPLIRADGNLGPQGLEEISEINQGIFPYEKVIRNLWSKNVGQKFKIPDAKKETDEKEYIINFTNQNMLALGPSGNFIAQSYVLKGHFNNFNKILKPKCQNLSVKYLQGIYSYIPMPRLNYSEVKYAAKQFAKRQQVKSYPYQIAMFSHQYFGNNIRLGLDSCEKLLKGFNQDMAQWTNSCNQIADRYMGLSINSEDD